MQLTTRFSCSNLNAMAKYSKTWQECTPEVKYSNVFQFGNFNVFIAVRNSTG